MQDTFDYIVVGAGSAGCVIADRLSEDGKSTVLLLEAGGRDSNPWIHVPIGFGRTFFDEKVNWCLRSEACDNLNSRQIYLPCGKVLGGSSSINGLLYVRGQGQDYDEWATQGSSGWAWDDVLPYFIRSEDQSSKHDRYHGRGGPLPVSDQVELNPLCEAFLQSAAAAGHRRTDDFNTGDHTGFGWFQVTARRGRRKSTAVAFLRRAEKRDNFLLRTQATAASIIVKDGIATGVNYDQGNTRKQVFARKGVILSGGAFHSPALLQRSGIGNPEWLQDAGITVRHALKGVGANLQDHLQAKLVYRTKKPITLNDTTRSLAGKLRMGIAYALYRRGPLTTAGAQAGGFASTRLSPGRPDVQFHVSSFSSADLQKGLDPFSAVTISAYQMRPESRGTVRVTGSDSSLPAKIFPNYLDSEIDRQTLIEGLRIGRSIASVDPFKASLISEERPGVNTETDDELLSYIRETAASVFHPVGTCAMGTDGQAVVDSRLKVHGLEHLFVADASIMPRIVSANTNAACIMIGEHAADLIRNPAT